MELARSDCVCSKAYEEPLISARAGLCAQSHQSATAEAAVKMRYLVLAALAAATVATPAGRTPNYGGNALSSILSSLTKLLQDDAAETGPLGPITNQIIKDYVEPIEVSRRYCWSMLHDC